MSLNAFTADGQAPPTEATCTAADATAAACAAVAALADATACDSVMICTNTAEDEGDCHHMRDNAEFNAANPAVLVRLCGTAEERDNWEHGEFSTCQKTCKEEMTLAGLNTDHLPCALADDDIAGEDAGEDAGVLCGITCAVAVESFTCEATFAQGVASGVCDASLSYDNDMTVKDRCPTACGVKACTYTAAAPPGADFYAPVSVPTDARTIPAHCSWVGAQTAAADPTATTCDQPAQGVGSHAAKSNVMSA